VIAEQGADGLYATAPGNPNWADAGILFTRRKDKCRLLDLWGYSDCWDLQDSDWTTPIVQAG
jgi:hypothetical protein